MALPHEKLAESLTVLRKLQAGGRRIFKSSEFSRVHRERLLKNGFLRDVIKGWLMSSGPQAEPGDTTPWYASFWEFCARYCDYRFDADWFLSAEQSLLLHGQASSVPRQVIVNSVKGSNNTVELLFGSSIYDLRIKELPPADDLTAVDGVRLFTADAALVRVPEVFFQRSPIEAQVALGGVRDVSGILRRLLDGGHSAIAGRLAGAFRRVGRDGFADEIFKTMRGAGYDVRESDPFDETVQVRELRYGIAPIVGRLAAIWAAQRERVLEVFPKPPGMPKEPSSYMRFVEDIYRSDAYHSLSIEGYSVTPELIDRVRQGGWSPDVDERDRQSRDALAARGYWQAFQKVKETIGGILDGGDAGLLVREQHRDWYRELFSPSVAAGILKPGALAGYRNQPVYLRGSAHVPPRSEVVSDAMQALFALLENEPEPAVNAVLGHWLFGYIHPYPDGNGRMARFLMNAMLSAGGYPWTVVRVEDREEYLAGLEAASVGMDVTAFAVFLAGRVSWSIKAADRG